MDCSSPSGFLHFCYYGDEGSVSSTPHTRHSLDGTWRVKQEGNTYISNSCALALLIMVCEISYNAGHIGTRQNTELYKALVLKKDKSLHHSSTFPNVTRYWCQSEAWFHRPSWRWILTKVSRSTLAALGTVGSQQDEEYWGYIRGRDAGVVYRTINERNVLGQQAHSWVRHWPLAQLWWGAGNAGCSLQLPKVTNSPEKFSGLLHWEIQGGKYLSVTSVHSLSGCKPPTPYSASTSRPSQRQPISKHSPASLTVFLHFQP